jgi:hypothetical protein
MQELWCGWETLPEFEENNKRSKKKKKDDNEKGEKRLCPTGRPYIIYIPPHIFPSLSLVPLLCM